MRGPTVGRTAISRMSVRVSGMDGCKVVHHVAGSRWSRPLFPRSGFPVAPRWALRRAPRLGGVPAEQSVERFDQLFPAVGPDEHGVEVEPQPGGQRARGSAGCPPARPRSTSSARETVVPRLGGRGTRRQSPRCPERRQRRPDDGSGAPTAEPFDPGRPGHDTGCGRRRGSPAVAAPRRHGFRRRRAAVRDGRLAVRLPRPASGRTGRGEAPRGFRPPGEPGRPRCAARRAASTVSGAGRDSGAIQVLAPQKRAARNTAAPDGGQRDASHTRAPSMRSAATLASNGSLRCKGPAP